MDITGQDEGVGLTIHHLVFASRIQCIWKTVFEHPGELRVFQLGLCGGDRFLYGFGCELQTYWVVEAAPANLSSAFSAIRANECWPTIRLANERPPVFRKFLRVVICLLFI